MKDLGRQLTVVCAVAALEVASGLGCAAGDTTPNTSGDSAATRGTGAGGHGGRGGAGGVGGVGGIGGQAGAPSGGGGNGGGTGGTGGQPCAADQKVCDSQCVDVSDPAYGCAASGCAPCAVPNASATCDVDQCTLSTCDPGFSNCDGLPGNGCEVDTNTSVFSCGACGNTCSFPNGIATCVQGVCTLDSCQGKWVDCDGIPDNGCEALIGYDPNNCTGCGVPCPPGEQCEASVCGVFCTAGKANCDGDSQNGCETDLGTQGNCGFCFDDCNVANAVGQCATDVCVIVSCLSGYADCDGVVGNGCEVDLQGSAVDCGACGVVCPSGPNSTAICSAGTCSLVCDGGFADCNGDPNDGCEQAIATDTSNCGACGVVCSVANGMPACVAGACVIASCNGNFADCNSLYPDGCEVDTTSSIANCGDCGQACPNVANGAPACTGGVCTALCNAGFGDCNGLVGDGCEVATNTDPTHCGSCANACVVANGTPGCAGGVCTVAACNSGFANCDGLAANGCETNVFTSISDCGGCNVVCSIPNGTPTCSAGSCMVGSCNPPFANCDGLAANGCETNTQTDPQHCGSCAGACAVANGTAGCSAGACVVASCNAGHADCNGNAADGCETNTQTDPAHCGSCSGACSIPNGTAACSAGACVIGACNPGFADCNGNSADGCETNLQSDVNHCGTCVKVCSTQNGQAACTAGACTVAGCNPGFADCNGSPIDGCEINTQTNVGHCGTCATICSAQNGVPGCSSGACTIVSCNAPFADCDSVVADGCEANTQTNVANCGGCGTACSVAHGTPACSGGACVIASCTSPYADCNANASDGCEANTQTSASNCGGCGNVCTAPNGTPTCTGGTCTVSNCNPGFADCNGSSADGCEANLNTSVSNCGGCGNTCTVANGTPACSGGACGVAACNPGYADCNGGVGDGCEVNIQTSVSNCGSCGTACSAPNGTPACSAGSCTVAACNGGFANCNGIAADGCEINTNTSPTNCGACGNTCSFAHGSGACNSGTCALVACDAGWGNCNGNPADGCETNLTTNVGSCGTCGNVCSTANGTPACSGGSCTIASCNAGFANCNGVVGDGCETNLNTSVSSCGACGTICSTANGTPACSGGTCAIATCNPGFGNCNGVVADGCETNTTTSVSNCGVCGNVCNVANGTAGCTAGSCTVASCNSGFGNCNGNVLDGCEVNLNTSVSNCGGCGNSCPAQCANHVSATACTAGSCGIIACNASYYDIDTQCADGCECLSSNLSSACTTPTSIGTLSVGQTVTHTANLIPAGKENWYVVTFTGNTNASYHPHIYFSVNPNSAFAFDIRSNCSGGTLACGEGGSSNAITDWETYFPGVPGYYNPIPPVGTGGSVYIHVYRKNGFTVNCNNFTLTISN